MTDTLERVLWRDCLHCGNPFVQSRGRGRPKVTCSDECKAARGVHGDVRLTRGASRGAVLAVVLDTGERHTSFEATAAVMANIFGGDSEGDVPAFITEGYRRRELMRAIEHERADAGEGVCVSDLYGLDPALDEGRTCPNVKRVIGVSDPWDWQERLGA